MKRYWSIGIIATAVAAASTTYVHSQSNLAPPASGRRPPAASEKSKKKARQVTPAITTTLMFEGRAEEAMKFYLSLFKDSKVIALDRWQPGEPGPEGRIKHAIFSLGGQILRCMDSSVDHPFTFTASTSLFVTCRSAAQIDVLYAKLSEGGQVVMPLQTYPFAKKYVWLTDRFGVSWQLHLPND
jgi:predicted 3-demethylubiquinone-9 3-methyltransferase (glyoxalase superfamily)